MPVYVMTFQSTHAAMAASKSLSSGGFSFRTIPVPAAISAGCGMALMFESPDAEGYLDRVLGSGGAADAADVVALYERDSPSRAGSPSYTRRR